MLTNFLAKLVITGECLLGDNQDQINMTTSNYSETGLSPQFQASKFEFENYLSPV